MRNLVIMAAVLAFTACGGHKTGTGGTVAEKEDGDTTIYGTCSSGTSMHSLELVTGMNDTLVILIEDGWDSDDSTTVAGGLMAGDRMAVTAGKGREGLVGRRIVNITSLLGRWTSIDKDFELSEDGGVKSNLRAETKSWTGWRIFNGHLLLDRDTFDVVRLSADSLDLENDRGIFSFRRVRKARAEEKDTLASE